MVESPMTIINIIIVNAFQAKRAMVLFFNIFLYNLLCHGSCFSAAVTSMFYKYDNSYFRFIHWCECCEPRMVIKSCCVSLESPAYYLCSACLSGDLCKA